MHRRKDPIDVILLKKQIFIFPRIYEMLIYRARGDFKYLYRLEKHFRLNRSL